MALRSTPATAVREVVDDAHPRDHARAARQCVPRRGDSILKRILGMFKDAVLGFIRDDAISLAAAISFYSALSFAPLLVLLLWVTSTLGHDAQAHVVDQVYEVIGPQAGEAVDLVVKNVRSQPQWRTFAGLVGIGTLFFSASGVFAQLQYALNRVWGVKAKPGAGLRSWIRKRLLSMGMIIAIGFLLMVSLGISAALSAVLSGDGVIWQAINIIVSLLVFTLLFALVYRVLPDVNIGWSVVAVGAGLTACLFALGKYLIGLYLGRSAVGSSYGAAGSLLLLLMWVYYSSIIVLVGAELTEAFAGRFGSRITPDKHSVWLEPIDEGDKQGPGKLSGVCGKGSACHSQVGSNVSRQHRR